MKENDDIALVKECIDKISVNFRKNADIYFNESDLQNSLFVLLLEKFNTEVDLKNISVWGTDKPMSVRKVTTRRLHSELLLPEGRIDLAILDVGNTFLAVNSKGHNPGFRIEKGNHIFIEIKASRTSRSSITSRKKWRHLILSDVTKLKRYENPCFLLCFDFNQLLNSREVASIQKKAKKNIKVIYVQNDKCNNYFVNG